MSQQHSPAAQQDIHPGIRFILIFVGLVLIGLGVYAILEGGTQVKPDSAIAALVATGVLLVVAGGFANRIKSFKGAGVEVVLQDIQAKTNALEKVSERLDGASQSLTAAAESLLTAVTRNYEAIHSLPESADRTTSLKGSAATVRLMADQVTREKVSSLSAGGEGDRLTAVILMRQRLDLADLGTLRRVVDSPNSNFEQFHALNAIGDLVSSNRVEDPPELLVWIDKKIRSDAFASQSPDEVSSRDHKARQIRALLSDSSIKSSSADSVPSAGT